jgi:hypothetical protein
VPAFIVVPGPRHTATCSWIRDFRPP